MPTRIGINGFGRMGRLALRLGGIDRTWSSCTSTKWLEDRDSAAASAAVRLCARQVAAAMEPSSRSHLRSTARAVDGRPRFRGRCAVVSRGVDVVLGVLREVSHGRRASVPYFQGRREDRRLSRLR